MAHRKSTRRHRQAKAALVAEEVQAPEPIVLAPVENAAATPAQLHRTAPVRPLIDLRDMIIGRHSPERMAQIFVDNVQLHKRIQAIKGIKPVTPSIKPTHIQSHAQRVQLVIAERAKEAREREQRRIHEQNVQLVEKLKKAPPSPYSWQVLGPKWRVTQEFAHKMSRTQDPKVCAVCLGGDVKLALMRHEMDFTHR
jgi:hypothetical protein